MPAASASGRAVHRLPGGLVIALLALVVGNYVALTLNLSARWEPWGNSDAPHYLHIARRIHDGKGFTSLGPEQFHVEQGMTKHPETNRQPLFCYLISLLAGPDRGFIIRARLLNVGIGVMVLLAAFFVGRSGGGARAALGGIILLGLLDALMRCGGEAMAESLAALWFLLFFYCVYRLDGGYRWWIAAGAFAALAWLTKGTGLLLLVGFIVTAAVGRLSRREKLGAVAVVAAAFVVVSSPLMFRNLTYFGDPLYNMNTRHVMWTDGWDVIGGGGRMLYDAGDRPTMARYLASHSAADIVGREVRGLRFAAYWLTQVFAVRVPNLQSWVRAVVGAPLLLLALAGVYRERRRELRALLVTLLVVFWVLIGWYNVIGPSHRLWFPLLPILFLYVGEVLVYLRDRKLARLWPNLPLAVPVICLGLIFALGQLYAWRNVPRSPFPPHPQSTSARVAEQWQRDNLTEESIVFGTSTDRPETFIPNYHNFVEFQVAAQRLGLEYLVLNTASFKHRAHIFGQYIELDDQTGALALKQPLPGWEPVYETPQHVSGEPDYMTFRRLE